MSRAALLARYFDDQSKYRRASRSGTASKALTHDSAQADADEFSDNTDAENAARDKSANTQADYRTQDLTIRATVMNSPTYVSPSVPALTSLPRCETVWLAPGGSCLTETPGHYVIGTLGPDGTWTWTPASFAVSLPPGSSPNKT